MSVGIIASSFVDSASNGAADSAYQTAVLADSPWGFWRFKGVAPSLANAGSLGGTFNPGTGITYKRPALAGDGGYSISTSGVGALAYISTTPASLVSGSVSVAGWVNIPVGGASGAFAKVGGGEGGWNIGIGGTAINNVGLKLMFLMDNAAFHATTYTFTPGKHHIMCTRSVKTGAYTSTYTIYVDGVQVWQEAWDAIDASGGIAIGGQPAGGIPVPANVDFDNWSFHASVLSASRATAHYNGGLGSNTAIAADSPVVWLKLDEAPANNPYADASPNGRNLSLGGVYGPDSISGPIDQAFSWRARDGYLTGPSVAQPTTVTYETWVYYSANPTADTFLCTFSGSGGSGATSGITLTAAGKIQAVLYPAASLTDPDVLTKDKWNHVVCSVGPAGAKIRINKTTKVTSAATSVMSAATGLFRVRNGGPNASAATGAVALAELATYYNTQLTDTKTDAHYNASGVV